MLNTAVTLGRLGMMPQLITEIGTDSIGRIISKFLKQNGVLTDYSYYHQQGQTPIAIAVLDASRNASYDFYRNSPAERLVAPLPNFATGDLVMFGSYFSISPDLRGKVKQILLAAQQAGATLFYDPNFRKAHLHQLPMLLDAVRENLKMAHIVRGSDEDFEILFGCRDAHEAHAFCCQATLFYTAGPGGCTIVTPDGNSRHWPSEAINPVSTIGAGDTFNAGLAYGISLENLTFDTPPPSSSESWNRVVKRALQMAASVCLSFDNYISVSLADKITDGTKD